MNNSDCKVYNIIKEKRGSSMDIYSFQSGRTYRLFAIEALELSTICALDFKITPFIYKSTSASLL